MSEGKIQITLSYTIYYHGKYCDDRKHRCPYKYLCMDYAACSIFKHILMEEGEKLLRCSPCLHAEQVQ